MAIQLIEMEHDKAGNRWVLWSKGNYLYEIENRKTGATTSLYLEASENSLADARNAFFLAIS